MEGRREGSVTRKNSGRVASYFCREYYLMNKEITNHGINKTVSDCVTVDQFVKRIPTKKNEQILVCLSTIILHYLVPVSYTHLTLPTSAIV